MGDDMKFATISQIVTHLFSKFKLWT